jgi:hypothetical protein
VRAKPAELSLEFVDPATQKEIVLSIDQAVSIAPKGGFRSADEAAHFLDDKLFPISAEYQIEIGAFIAENDGRYMIDGATTDFINNEVNLGHRIFTSRYHTHPASRNIHSGDDAVIAEMSGAPNSYVSNKVGLYRYRANEYRMAYKEALPNNKPGRSVRQIRAR